MSYHNKSRQEMLDVQYATRLRLCKVQALLGMFFLLVFSWISYLNQSIVLAGILFVCALICTVVVYLLYRTNRIEIAVNLSNINLFLLPLTLLVTGGHENTGILWIYPTLAVGLFVNRLWPAVTLYGSFIFISSLLLFTPMSELLMASYSFSESIRFEVTLFLLSLICLSVLHSKERADEMIIQLHDEDIRKLAYYDALTGLPNRRNFKSNLTRLLRRAGKEDKRVGLLYIDLDNFKQVNDNYGHEVGDILLRSFSDLLKETVRPTDMIMDDKFDELARLGGDEFVVILNDLSSPISSAVVAERILKLFENGFETVENTHSVFASIGIATFPDDAATPDELLHHADLAMYEAKRNGRNRFEYYTKDIAELLRERNYIEEQLKIALEQNQLSLVYMPVFSCRTLEIVGIEALLRCQNLAEEGITPEQFISVAEKTNLIKELDLWVIDNSLANLAELQHKQGFTGKVCINISGAELQNESFSRAVKGLLEKHRVVPSTVELEISETALLLSDEKIALAFEKIKALGVSITLDDFGTGSTAFGQLNHYPLDCLKIDSSFVKELFSEHADKTKMVKIVNNLGKLYDLRIAAKGVENQMQLEYLQEIDCDWVQGYLLSYPLKKPDLISFISQNNAVDLSVNCVQTLP
ncbi:putative bifunctional diguanylate cyclase/phosphodiesterase [Neptunomonas japonica]|uniref:putative bifunctional diguanylate cyclase/phosphodiesterase n=1 Tax=Neptunomonas japonica TaxID=417574 RepID=UPI0003FD3EE6|nr:EAL domain-containing protein [Neptunomonas japonica]